MFEQAQKNGIAEDKQNRGKETYLVPKKMVEKQFEGKQNQWCVSSRHKTKKTRKTTELLTHII